MKSKIVAYVGSCALIVSSLATSAIGDSVRVSRIIDGDTVELESGDRVRLIGVKAPTPFHQGTPAEFMGEEASLFINNLMEGKHVRLEYDVKRTDEEGRILAYVYVDTMMVNEELLRRGLAWVSTIPPNLRYERRFAEATREAQAHERGLWGSREENMSVTPRKATYAYKYYYSDTGRRYHDGACLYLSDNPIETTPAAATAMGYRPCLVCGPPEPLTLDDVRGRGGAEVEPEVTGMAIPNWNPDGHPGTVAIEPYFNYTSVTNSRRRTLNAPSSSDFDEDFDPDVHAWNAGLRFVIPIDNRSTFFFEGGLGLITSVAPESLGGLPNPIDIETSTANFSFGVSVRVWFGGAKGG